MVLALPSHCTVTLTRCTLWAVSRQCRVLRSSYEGWLVFLDGETESWEVTLFITDLASGALVTDLFLVAALAVASYSGARKEPLTLRGPIAGSDSSCQREGQGCHWAMLDWTWFCRSYRPALLASQLSCVWQFFLADQALRFQQARLQGSWNSDRRAGRHPPPS